MRELGLEVDAVLTMLDMARTLGATDPAVVPWLEEARATIERLRMPGLNGLLEVASGGVAGSAGSVARSGPGRHVRDRGDRLTTGPRHTLLVD